MKNYFFLAVAATLSLVACSENEIITDGGKTQVENQKEMTFSIGTKGQSRANSYGAAAAAMLGNKFTVEGTKGSSSFGSVVFDNYDVVYTVNTAENSTTNGADWEYIGLAANGNSSITTTQDVKYWDYSAAQYDFIAYSLGTGTATATAITPASATTTAYSVTGDKDNLAKVYIADVVTKKAGSYGGEVGINFRALAAKVRIAIYETIPGYSVKDVEFYESATATTTATSPVLFSASNTINTDGTYKVFFPTLNDETNSDNNKAHVAYTGTQVSTLSLPALNLTRTEASTDVVENYLGITSATATYAADKEFTTVLPNETAAALTLRVNYTLVSNDGSKEEIKVWGATAVVPAAYTSWKSNYTYTYVFKISDKTNGSTEALGGAEGLHPITFDAAVVDPEAGNATTVSTIETPSITTYQANFTPANAAAPVYNAGEDIYVMVQNGATLMADLDSKGQLYQLAASATEAEVMDALNMGSTAGSVTTGRNGVALTATASDATITAIPGVDGNEITVAAKSAAKITAPAAGTYAYVYTVSTGTPTTYNSAIIPASGASVTSYYEDFECTISASGTADGTTVYYQKMTNNNNVYAVKVIEVQ